MSTPFVEHLVDELAYPAFNPAFVPVMVDADTVEIRVGPWTGSSYRIQDRDRDTIIVDLIDSIDGKTHVEELLAPFEVDERENFGRFLLDLADEGVIYDSGKPTTDNWAHLTLRPELGDQGRARLESNRVLVVSPGDLGAQVANDLRTFDVEEIGMLDPLSPNTTPEPDDAIAFDRDNLEAAVAAADLVVYTASRPYPDVEARIDEAAHDHGTPWTSARINGFDGFVGPTVFPGETGCYRCFEQRMLATFQEPHRYQVFLQHMAENSDTAQLQLPGLGRMLAGYLMMDIGNLLAFGTGYTAGRVFVVDGMHLSVECNDVLKLPRCDRCGKERGDARSQFTDVEHVVRARERFEGGDGQ